MENILELIMIVKNSGDILKYCLEQNKQFIDHWTILDTGSTDNTKEIIKDILKDKPGNLYCDNEFINFSDARNKCLNLSSKTCKYQIILDDSYVIQNGYKLRQILTNTKKICYSMIIANYHNNYLHNSYSSIRIIKTSEMLRYKYRVHEHIVVEEKKVFYIDENDAFINDIETTEHKNRSVSRYIKDIQFLLKDHNDYPYDPRVIYYLAKTYYNMENYKKTIEFYSKLNKLNNLHKEYYFVADYELKCVKFILDGDIIKFQVNLLSILNKYKDRPEINYKLAVISKELGNLEECDEILSLIVNCKKPKLFYTILESDIYDYFITYLYIDVKIQLGQLNIAIPYLKKLLSFYPNNQPLLNIKYALCDVSITNSPIKLSNNKTIVFHTGGEQSIFKNWNPKGDSRISGSEYMAMNLSKEFYKLGYRVFIIGSFEDTTLNVDYQCIHEGIEYIDYKYFSEFALKYVVDILVISRYTSNLVYYDNIKSVYLWVHDVLPVIDESKCFQIHKEKFKKIIAISNWQKNNIIQKLNIPSENIIVSRNAIYPERFVDKNVEKIPYRFIYTSDPSRGLSNLINLIPTIKEKFPETTLHVFVKKENIDFDTLEKINKLDYVFVHGRVPQNELAIEFLKSDIFFYPTDFKETYCLSVVEAMCSKCIVVTVKLAALTEIVETRGILCNYPIRDNNKELLSKLFFVLERPRVKNYLIENAYKWAINQNFEKLVNEWVKILEEN